MKNSQITLEGLNGAHSLKKGDFVYDKDTNTMFAGVGGIVRPSGTITITENGDHDVTQYENARVNVPSANPPSGTIQITENGTVDVTNYASAEVAVPEPTGATNITENGTYDVSQYANAVVNVQYSEPATTVLPLNGFYLTDNRLVIKLQFVPTVTYDDLNIDIGRSGQFLRGGTYIYNEEATGAHSTFVEGDIEFATKTATASGYEGTATIQGWFLVVDHDNSATRTDFASATITVDYEYDGEYLTFTFPQGTYYYNHGELLSFAPITQCGHLSAEVPIL